jgi:hypothetical protein
VDSLTTARGKKPMKYEIMTDLDIMIHSRRNHEMRNQEVKQPGVQFARITDFAAMLSFRRFSDAIGKKSAQNILAFWKAENLEHLT